MGFLLDRFVKVFHMFCGPSVVLGVLSIFLVCVAVFVCRC